MAFIVQNPETEETELWWDDVTFIASWRKIEIAAGTIDILNNIVDAAGACGEDLGSVKKLDEISDSKECL